MFDAVAGRYSANGNKLHIQSTGMRLEKPTRRILSMVAIRCGLLRSLSRGMGGEHYGSESQRENQHALWEDHEFFGPVPGNRVTF